MVGLLPHSSTMTGSMLCSGYCLYGVVIFTLCQCVFSPASPVPSHYKNMLVDTLAMLWHSIQGLESPVPDQNKVIALNE